MKLQNNSTQVFILGLIMVVASYLGYKLKPIQTAGSQTESFNLERSIPSRFKGWEVDDTVVPVKVDPQVQANLDKTYDQVLSRTYKNQHGERVMLSIAYGSKQSKTLQVHKPETCYTAQGFLVNSSSNINYSFENYRIKAREVVAVNGARVEPIIYWIRFGDTTAYGGIEQTIKRVQLGLKGVVADGLLFRVSTIDSNVKVAYEKEGLFIHDLLSAIDSKERPFFIGLPK